MRFKNYIEKIEELFENYEISEALFLNNKDVKFKGASENNVNFEFVANNRRYVVVFSSIENKKWNLNFHLVSGDAQITGIVKNTPNPLKIFDGVGTCVIKFLNQYKPEIITFSGVEKHRIKIYDKLIKSTMERFIKLVPEYIFLSTGLKNNPMFDLEDDFLPDEFKECHYAIVKKELKDNLVNYKEI